MKENDSPERKNLEPIKKMMDILPIVLMLLLLLSGLVALLFRVLQETPLLSRWPEAATVYFISQIIFFTTVTCLIPTCAYGLTTVFYWLTERQHRTVHAIVESVLFVALFLLFGLWLFGSAISGIGIAYAAMLILLLEVGKYIVKWHKERTLKRLSNAFLLKSLNGLTGGIERLSREEASFYFSVPLGLIIGTIVGVLRHQTPQVAIVFCLQLVFLLASLSLLYFLVYGFRRMCDPMFKTSQVKSPEIAEKQPKGFFLKMAKRIRVPIFLIQFVVPPKTEKEDQEKQDLDLACDISELRKVYMYDALHNTILLVAFIATVLRGWGVAIDVWEVVISLSLATLLLTEMPYWFGQYLLHEKALERYTGSKYAEIKKKLNEKAPKLPPLPILGTLATSLTGGFLFFLLNQFVQNALQNIVR